MSRCGGSACLLGARRPRLLLSEKLVVPVPVILTNVLQSQNKKRPAYTESNETYTASKQAYTESKQAHMSQRSTTFIYIYIYISQNMYPPPPPSPHKHTSPQRAWLQEARRQVGRTPGTTRCNSGAPSSLAAGDFLERERREMREMS